MENNFTTFSKKEAIGFGWQFAKRHFFFVLGIVVVMFLVIAIPQMIAAGLLASSLPEGLEYQNDQEKMEALLGSGALSGKVIVIVGVLYLFAVVMQFVTQLGLLKTVLNLVDYGKASFKDLFSSYRLFFKFIGLTILMVLILGVGFLLLIVPCLIWTFKYFYAPYVMADKGLGPIESLRQSALITRGNKWNLFLLMLLLMLINFAGMLAFGIGMLFTMQITMGALVYVYRKLGGQGACCEADKMQMGSQPPSGEHIAAMSTAASGNGEMSGQENRNEAGVAEQPGDEDSYKL